MAINPNKKSVLIATQDQDKIKTLEAWIKKRMPDTIVFNASDYTDSIQKIRNATPVIFFSEYILAKGKAGQIIESIVGDSKLKLLPIIILSPLPEKESHLDEIVTGKLQFLDKIDQEADFDRCLTKALNFANQNQNTDYHVRYLSPGDLLMKEGDPADQIFIVKKGQLKAYQSNPEGVQRILGNIEPGEFVGEMGYFNGEARICNVEAVTECELIEVPLGTFEKVLYLRPAWSKKLMETLSRRLKRVTPKT